MTTEADLRKLLAECLPWLEAYRTVNGLDFTPRGLETLNALIARIRIAMEPATGGDDAV